MTKRVLIAGFKHETNTFSKLPTDMAAYKARTYYRDDEVASKMRGTATEIGAALDAAERHGWSICHPIYANATPSGKVTKDMHDHVLSTASCCACTAPWCVNMTRTARAACCNPCVMSWAPTCPLP